MKAIMKTLFSMLLTLAILSTLVVCAWVTARIIAAVSFDINCEQHLKRAADANTIEVAEQELEKAITYLEENNLTTGIVSIFWEQPQNDIGFWYNNLISSLEELENLPEDASALEKNTVLMKLHETLTDSGSYGTVITHPYGISIYPNNVAYFWWGTISLILAIFFWTVLFVGKKNYWFI